MISCGPAARKASLHREQPAKPHCHRRVSIAGPEHADAPGDAIAIAPMSAWRAIRLKIVRAYFFAFPDIRRASCQAGFNV